MMDSDVWDRSRGHRAPTAESRLAEHRQAATDSRRALLLARFLEAGYRTVDTPILQPAATFLDFSGEGIRSHLFLTTDAAGREMCLRPEYTIPVCLAYLAGSAGTQAGSAGTQAAYAYCGPVFRAEAGGPGQFLQSGLESFGRTDTASADAEVLVLTLQAAAAAGFTDPEVRMGDAGLLARLFDVLKVPPAWQRRLKRGLDKGQRLDDILADRPGAGTDHSGVIAALTGTDQMGARALVEDLLSIAGIATVGGRSAAEIAERFLAQVAHKASPAFGGEQRAVLQAFLNVSGSPDDASAELRTLADEARLDLEEALELFDERNNFIAVHELDVTRLTFQASFGRNLDYYTGFVFEARHAGRAQTDVVIGGGRYDRLAQSLGSPDPVPAVGASIWVERLPVPQERDADA